MISDHVCDVGRLREMDGAKGVMKMEDKNEEK
jgi:hypothetical protein